MDANIFAGCMIAILVVGVVLIKTFGARPTVFSSLVGILLAPLLLIIMASVSLHLCYRGASHTSGFLAALLAGIAFACISKLGTRIVVVGFLAISGGAMMFWSAELAHVRPYVCNAGYTRIIKIINTAELRDCGNELREKAEQYPQLVLSQGWLDDVWRKAVNEQLLSIPSHYQNTTPSIGRFWHTWFTGIYRLDGQPIDIWCPGGTLLECADKIEYRDRPKT